MKNLIIALLTLTAMPAMANTTPPVAVPVRILFPTAPVTASTYTPILNLTAKGVKGIMASNGSDKDINVGVSVYGATANTESAQFTVPANSGAQFYPLGIASGMRISIISIGNSASTGGSASTGTGVFDVFYY